VRILFTFEGGSGHYNPLVPVARAAESAGHTVAFAWTAPSIIWPCSIGVHAGEVDLSLSPASRTTGGHPRLHIAGGGDGCLRKLLSALPSVSSRVRLSTSVLFIHLSLLDLNCGY
jgi:hypothetical protein